MNIFSICLFLPALVFSIPSVVDNSQNEYFYKGYDQGLSGSCMSVSHVTMAMTYEKNAFQRTPADSSTLLPPYFTWQASKDQNADEMLIAQKVGVPDAKTYGGILYSLAYGKDSAQVSHNYGWMQGYSRWYQAMFNRVDSIIKVSLSTKSGIDSLKGWLFNHWEDSDFDVGGIAAVSVATESWSFDTLENDSGKWPVAISLPGNTNHSVVIVGFDDNTCYKNMCGCWILQNSWGADWGNKGRFLIPYSIFASSASPDAEVIHIRKGYYPKRTLKIKMSYKNRAKISLSIGISSDTTAEKPDRIENLYHFYNNGFSGPMLGTWADGKVHEEPMEFGYDMTDLSKGFDLRKPLKYYFRIKRSDYEDDGFLNFLSVKDYSSDTLIQELPIIKDSISLEDEGFYEWSFVMPGNIQNQSEYIYNVNYLFLKVPQTERESKLAYLKDYHDTTSWSSVSGLSYPSSLYFTTEEETIGLVYRANKDLEGVVREYAILGGNDTTAMDTLVNGMFYQKEEDQYAFWSHEKYPFIKFVVKGIWPSEEISGISAAGIYLLTKPSELEEGSSGYSENMVLSGLPDEVYPFPKIEDVNSLEVKKQKKPFSQVVQTKVTSGKFIITVGEKEYLLNGRKK